MSCGIVHKDDKIGFKQLFDDESSTYTYLLWDTKTLDAVIVDPVDIQVDRDIKEAQDLGLKLHYGGKWFLILSDFSKPNGLCSHFLRSQYTRSC